MTKENLIEKLSAPFTKDVNGNKIPDIKWRVGQVFNDPKSKTGMTCTLLAYIDARQVASRLDEVCGSDWSKKLTHHDKSAISTISILIEGTWIDRDGLSDQTKIEAEKGAESKSLVRAASNWGIGRYLYALPAMTLPCKKIGKDTTIYAIDGVTVLHQKAISDYVNIQFQIPLMKLTELWMCLDKDQQLKCKPHFEALWNLLKI